MKSTVVPLSQRNSTRGDVVKKRPRFQGWEGGTPNETSKVTSVSPSPPHLFPSLGVSLPSCLYGTAT